MSGTETSRFEVLSALAREFTSAGLEVTVASDTICVGREQWDKYSRRILTMLSSAPAIKVGDKTFFVFVTEQYDSNSELKKYSITLTEEARKPLYSWDLDTKRGTHGHEYDYRGSKLPGHLPHDLSLPMVAAENHGCDAYVGGAWFGFSQL